MTGTELGVGVWERQRQRVPVIQCEKQTTVGKKSTFNHVIYLFAILEMGTIAHHAEISSYVYAHKVILIKLNCYYSRARQFLERTGP